MADNRIELSSRLLRLGRKLNLLYPLEEQQRQSETARVDHADGSHTCELCIHYYGWARAVVRAAQSRSQQGAKLLLGEAIALAEHILDHAD